MLGVMGSMGEICFFCLRPSGHGPMVVTVPEPTLTEAATVTRPACFVQSRGKGALALG